MTLVLIVWVGVDVLNDTMMHEGRKLLIVMIVMIMMNVPMVGVRLAVSILTVERVGQIVPVKRVIPVLTTERPSLTPGWIHRTVTAFRDITETATCALRASGPFAHVPSRCTVPSCVGLFTEMTHFTPQ